MTAGSCSVAISRSRPPQCGHASTSMPKARCMRAAQVQARGVDFTPASPRPAARRAVEAVGSGAGIGSLYSYRPPESREEEGERDESQA